MYYYFSVFLVHFASLLLCCECGISPGKIKTGKREKERSLIFISLQSLAVHFGNLLRSEYFSSVTIAGCASFDSRSPLPPLTAIAERRFCCFSFLRLAFRQSFSDYQIAKSPTVCLLQLNKHFENEESVRQKEPQERRKNCQLS